MHVLAIGNVGSIIESSTTQVWAYLLHNNDFVIGLVNVNQRTSTTNVTLNLNLVLEKAGYDTTTIDLLHFWKSYQIRDLWNQQPNDNHHYLTTDNITITTTLTFPVPAKDLVLVHLIRKTKTTTLDL